MIYRKLDAVKNEILHDAILISNYKYPFIRVFIDRTGGAAILFKGKMPEQDIKWFFFNMNENINSESKVSDEETEYDIEFKYDEDTTEIYTRDGFNYWEHPSVRR